MTTLPFTGERMIPEHNLGTQLYQDHIERYQMACEYAKGKVIVDVACGSGYGSKMLAEAGAQKVIGIDSDPQTILYAKERFKDPVIEFRVGDCRKMKRIIPSHSADMVVSFETIEHIRETDKFVKEVKRILKKDGLWFVSTPNFDVYKSQSQFHPKMFTEAEFKKVLQNHFDCQAYYYQHNKRYIVGLAFDRD